MKLHEMDQRLDVLAELVTSGAMAPPSNAIAPMAMIQRDSPEEIATSRRINPSDLIRLPRPPYSTEYFAAPSGMVAALEGKTKPQPSKGLLVPRGTIPALDPSTGATASQPPVVLSVQISRISPTSASSPRTTDRPRRK